MIINSQNLADLNRGFKATFQGAFEKAKPLYPEFATEVPSSTSEEKFAWLGQFPRLREWIGARHIKALAAHDYTIKNKDFESTVSVPRNAIDDDQYGVYTPLFAEMGYAAATHPDELVFELMAALFATPCYDGQFFIDTDHPVGVAGQTEVTSVSNHGGGGGTPWLLLDLSRPIKPILFQKRKAYQFVPLNKPDDANVFHNKEFIYGVDGRGNVGVSFWQMAFGSKQTLNAANFVAHRAAMRAFRSDEGRPLNILPTHLVVGPSLEAAADALINVRTLPEGGDNPNFNKVKVSVVPWLP